MGRIQSRDFDIEAGQLGLIPSLPLSQLGPWSTRPLSKLCPWSTRSLVISALGQLGQAYSACCSITNGDVHVLMIVRLSILRKTILIPGLLQDNMDKKCFLGVNFSTSTNHLLFNTML